MAVIKKVLPWLFAVSLLSFVTSCDKIFLTQPYVFDGNVTVFMDGKMIGTYFEERIDSTTIASDGDINFSSDSDDTYGSIGLRDEFLVFHRLLSREEIATLYNNPGSLPADTTDIAGYYQFEDDLTCESSASGPEGVIDAGWEGTFATTYETGGVNGKALHISGEGDIIFNKDILPTKITEMTVNIWIKDTDLAGNILNCYGGSSHDDFFNMDIERGWVCNTYHDISNYDSDSWHMLTMLITEYN